jgi:hypothetical protein
MKTSESVDDVDSLLMFRSTARDRPIGRFWASCLVEADKRSVWVRWGARSLPIVRLAANDLPACGRIKGRA